MIIPRHSELSALRLGDYLALLWPDRPQRAIQELFAKGRVRLGGKPASPTRELGEIATLGDLEVTGDLGSLPSIYLGEEDVSGALGTLHEDDRLIVLAKPSGLPVVPDRAQRLPSVLGCLIRRELAERAAKPPGQYVRYRIVHRIDRLTSGLVIVAKTPAAERELGAAFEGRSVRKEYLAILAGAVRPARFTVNCPIVPGRKGKMRAELPPDRSMEGPGSALTELEVVERFASHTLARAMPVTGRTHQIRVHAWAAGYPLAIDPLYGPKPDAFPTLPCIARLTLHARRYELPTTWPGARVFECPPPEDFEAAVNALRKG